jgi:DNA topoisomerase-1
VNAYLREISGIDLTAKDFRTWAGSVFAFECLASQLVPQRKKDVKRAVVEAVACVSQRLGNTPAVCRKSYIHPAVIEAFEGGSGLSPTGGRSRAGLSAEESALLRFLEAAEGEAKKARTTKKRPVSACVPAL